MTTKLETVCEEANAPLIIFEGWSALCGHASASAPEGFLGTPIKPLKTNPLSSPEAWWSLNDVPAGEAAMDQTKGAQNLNKGCSHTPCKGLQPPGHAAALGTVQQQHMMNDMTLSLITISYAQGIAVSYKSDIKCPLLNNTCSQKSSILLYRHC